MKKQNQLTVLLVGIVFFALAFASWGKKAEEYSVTERRKLAQLPEISLETVSDGSFMTDFEKYTLDQFPFRDQFRSLKAFLSNHILLKSDNNDIYVADGYAVKMEYPLNEKAISHSVKKFNSIYENYLKDQAGNIYLALIPDKNYFLAEKSGHLSMDYEQLFEHVQKEMPYAAYVDITKFLSVEDYYRTDTHWRQEQLVDVAQHLAYNMGVEVSGEFEKKTLEKEFYGVYFGQSALNLPGEPLSYLTNDVLEQCVVTNFENNTTTTVYDLKKAEGNDPYEIFLSGPVSLLTIENPGASTEKELIVFRDSFASSLIPLLAEGYQKITLIDIRYISSNFLTNFVDFTDKDVLYLYSTIVLNNGETLK